MEAIKQLHEFKTILDSELAKYLNDKIAEASKISPESKELVSHIKDLTLRGGKRIRAALMYYSYLAHGGRNRTAAFYASMSMELAETYFLIHDDIMDDDGIRRAGPTVHRSYEEISRERFQSNKHPEHFGKSIALLAGDLANAYSYDIITQAGFKSNLVNSAIRLFNNIYISEYFGQNQDFISGYKEKITQQELMLIHSLKTVPYTFELPLKLGAILAGAKDSNVAKLSQYAYNLGIAFQIQDDILGMFGEEAKTGKPVTSDLEEGKKTLLILDALAKADTTQKEIILKHLGRKGVTKEDLEEVKSIIRETGSLEYSKAEATRLASKAIEMFSKIRLKKEGKDFLAGIAEYMIKREY